MGKYKKEQNGIAGTIKMEKARGMLDFGVIYNAKVELMGGEVDLFRMIKMKHRM